MKILKDLGKVIKVGRDEIFRPGCKVEKEGSNSGRSVLICTPKLELKDGVKLVSERPIRMITEGKGIKIEDDGGAPDIVLEKVIKWVKDSMAI